MSDYYVRESHEDAVLKRMAGRPSNPNFAVTDRIAANAVKAGNDPAKLKAVLVDALLTMGGWEPTITRATGEYIDRHFAGKR